MNQPVITYQRPVTAKLVVRLENGEEWEATDADFAKFRLRDMVASYTAVHGLLCRLGLDPTGRHASLRYLLERTLSYPLDTDLAFDPDVDADDEDYDVLQAVRAGLAAWPDDDDAETATPGTITRLREALETIANGEQCTNFTKGTCREDPSRSATANEGASRWCDACIARAALDPT